MRVLLLGKENSKIANFLRNNEELISYEQKINIEQLRNINPSFIVSYNYRYIIREDIIVFLKGKIINLHIAFLPWNRGADPNLWSFVDNTPKGVTIHRVTNGLDKGEILLQEEMNFSDDETFRSSYKKLHETIQSLFINNWEALKNDSLKIISQDTKGTYHRIKDKEDIMKLLPEGWDTKILHMKKLLTGVKR